MTQRLRTARTLFNAFGAVSTVVLVALLMVPHASSQSSQNIDGWMWSSNIGWIALDCGSDPAGCGTAAGEWGLSHDQSGNITGYAWSNTVGWIKFGGLSGFPSGGESATNATFTNGRFLGWARACMGTAPRDCSTMVNNSSGWDGWISLSGASPAYAVVSNNATYDPAVSGAWGGDVVGWLGVYAGVTCATTPPTCTDSTHYATYTDSSCVLHPAGACDAGLVCVNGFGCTSTPPTGCLSAGVDVRSPSSCTAAVISSKVSKGQSTTLYWNVQNVTACTLTGNGQSGSGISGSMSSGAINSVATFTLSCTGATGGGSWQVLVNTLPVYKEQ